MKRFLLVLALLCLTACAPATPVSTPGVVTVYASVATQAWFGKLFECGGRQPAVIRMSASAADADVVLQVGAPANPSLPVFQIGSEDVLVVANPAHGAPLLSSEQVRELFTGQIDDWGAIDPAKAGKVQVWVFAQGNDVQQVLASTLGDTAVVSTARLATSPEEMAAAIAGDPNAIGILPRHWKPDNVQDVFTAASAPVLAITPSEPAGVVKGLLSCLQGK
jgi:hypothetical protein